MKPNLSNEVEEILNRLPSRIYVKDKEHHEHQLVIEKFPNKTWNTSYVCMSCKKKTTSHNNVDLLFSLRHIEMWVKDLRKMGEVVLEL